MAPSMAPAAGVDLLPKVDLSVDLFDNNVCCPQVGARQLPKPTENKESCLVSSLCPCEVVDLSVDLFSVSEISKLTGKTRQAIHKRLIREGILQERRSGTGHHKDRIEKVIPFEHFPRLFEIYPVIKTELEQRQAEATSTADLSAPPPAPIAPPTTPDALPALKDWQRERGEARIVVLRYIEELVQRLEAESHSLLHRGQRDRAIRIFVTDAEAGRLPEHIQALLAVANARAGSTGRTLSRRTIQLWTAAAKVGVDRLAPKATERPEPKWAPILLRLFQQPQKPSLLDVVNNRLPGLLPVGVKAPT